MQIATVSRTIRNNFFRYFFTVLGVFSPFLHLFAKSGQGGPLHWKWMSSFLNAFGWALFAFCIGIVMLLDSRFVAKEKRFPNIFRSFLVTGIGIYYMLYIFFPNAKNFDFTRPTYYLALAVVSSIITIVLIWMIKLDKSYLQDLMALVRKFFRYAKEVETDLIPETKPAHKIKRGELVNDALNVGKR